VHPYTLHPCTLFEEHLRASCEGFGNGIRGRTDGEALDGFVLGSAAGAVGATDRLCVATAMLVATVVSVC
jgi:hypothetical protein